MKLIFRIRCIRNGTLQLGIHLTSSFYNSKKSFKSSWSLTLYVEKYFRGTNYTIYSVTKNFTQKVSGSIRLEKLKVEILHNLLLELQNIKAKTTNSSGMDIGYACSNTKTDV
jgi:hypothetical protein